MAGGFYLPKDRKYYRVWIPWDGKKVFINKYVDGKRLYHPDQCRTVLGEIRAEIDAGTFSPLSWGKNRALIFEEAWEVYQEQEKCSRERERVREEVKDRYLLPYFRGKSIASILTANIKQWQGGIDKLKLSPGYKKLIQKVLKAFLNFHSDSLIRQPKFPKIEIPEKKINWLSWEDQGRVHEFIAAHHLPIFKFMQLVGCRMVEAANLRFEDIDIKKRTFTFRNTKNRTVNPLPITDEIEECFRRPKLIEEGNVIKFQPRNLLYVFSTANGGRYTTEGLYKVWRFGNRAANEKYGVPIVSNYIGNRHSFACQKLNAGKDMELIARVMGHTTTATTEKYYARYKTEKLIPLLGTQTVRKD
jgi:integrase